MSSLIWLQTGGCSGDSMALLCAESPDLLEFFGQTGIELLWHPSLSRKSPAALSREIAGIVAGRRELTVLCIDLCHPAYASQPEYADVVTAFAQLKGRLYQQTIRHSKRLLEIVAMFGGQWPHSSLGGSGHHARADDSQDALCGQEQHSRGHRAGQLSRIAGAGADQPDRRGKPSDVALVAEP